MLDKILVPIDGSEYAFKALDYAITFAKKFSSEIYIVHIVQTVAAIAYGTDITVPSFMVDLKNHLEENGKRILSTAEVKTKKAGVKAVTMLLYGSPAEEIVNFAEEKGVGLIVVGDRGLGSVARFFLGSVSNKVSRHAPCPVLIVKTQK